MNDATLTELKVVVERTVQPVRATRARKRRMREELLAHLVAIFEEEEEHGGDEQAALEQTKQRFGGPGELTGELQQTVTRRDRCRSILENMGYRPRESAWHLAARHLLVTLLIYLLWLPTWMLAFGRLRNPFPVEAQHLVALMLVGSVLLAALFNVILSVSLAWVLNKIGPVLAAASRGRVLLATLCGFAAVFGLVWPGFTGASVLFILMARQYTAQWRYQTAWA